METRQQRLIREALEHGSTKRSRDAEAGPEATLRDKSLEHTDPAYLPRTLTPHEWETYYAQRGIPREHRRPAQPGPAAGGLLRRLTRIFSRSADHRRASSGTDEE